jgi:hypothetical protein
VADLIVLGNHWGADRTPKRVIAPGQRREWRKRRFRKTYFRSVIDVIEVEDNVIRIKGDKDLLEKAIWRAAPMTTGVRGR